MCTLRSINPSHLQLCCYTTQAHQEGGLEGKLPRASRRLGAPPSLRNIKYTRMHHFGKKFKKFLCKNVWGFARMFPRAPLWLLMGLTLPCEILMLAALWKTDWNLSHAILFWYCFMADKHYCFKRWSILWQNSVAFLHSGGGATVLYLLLSDVDCIIVHVSNT